MVENLVTWAVWAAVLSLCAYCAWRAYDRRIGRRERLRAQQYRLFALRDRAFRLLAEGIADKADPSWQALYSHLNESAKTDTVAKMECDAEFAIRLLRQAPPRLLDDSDEVAPEVVQLWKDYRKTVLDICHDTIGNRENLQGIVRKLRRYQKEREAENLQAWEGMGSLATVS